MSRIPAVEPAAAKEAAASVLAELQKAYGSVPNLYRVAAHSSEALTGLVGLTKALGGGALAAPLKEQISIAVAERDGCEYCLSAHTFLGKRAGLSDADVQQARDGRAADQNSEAALRFAIRVLETAGRVDDGDLAQVRRAGFDNGAIIEIVANVALNFLTNSINNVARTKVDFPTVKPKALAA